LARDGTLTARTEDPSTWDSEQGLRDSLPEYLTCEVRRTTGSSVDLQGFWAWEAD